MELENLSEEEISRVEADVGGRLVRYMLAKNAGDPSLQMQAPQGVMGIDGRDMITINTTTDMLKNFRTVALTSYQKEQFYEYIPEFMRPFVNRDNTLEPGREVAYHESRMSYLKPLLQGIKENPLNLKAMERILLRFFLENLAGSQGEQATQQRISNAMLQFKQLEDNVCDLYSLYCLEELGRPNYILGIGDNGRVHTRQYAGVRREDEVRIYNDIHAHGVVFMNLDPSISGQIVPDVARWANKASRLSGLAHVNAGLAGFELLRSGQENKHFHSSDPHEIIINQSNVNSITVRDVPPDHIYFSTRFGDNTISIGAMGFITGTDQIMAYNSDMISQAIHVNRIVNNEANFLFDLAGAVARDMFVCVERDRYYSRSQSAGGRNREPRQRNRVTWLPRFKMNFHGETNHTAIMERVVSLSPCHVSGHPRRCANPSQVQIDIARSLGIALGPGHTYVQEHERSGSEQRRLYKSRSAMQVLFEARR